MSKIISLKLFPTHLQRFPQDMSERTIREAKKPNFCSHNHSFSPIINPVTFLETSAVPEYFGTIFIRLLRKIKNHGFLLGICPFWRSWKPLRLNFHHVQMKVVPKYSGTADISKKVTGLIIGEKQWLWEQTFGFLASRIVRSDMSCGNRCRFVGNNFRQIIFCTLLHYWVMYPKCQTDLKSDENCGL